MGGVLWHSWMKMRLAHSYSKSWVLGSPTGVLSKGYIRYTGCGRQGRLLITRAVGKIISETYISLWLYNYSPRHVFAGGAIIRVRSSQATWTNKMDTEAAIPWSSLPKFSKVGCSSLWISAEKKCLEYSRNSTNVAKRNEIKLLFIILAFKTYYQISLPPPYIFSFVFLNINFQTELLSNGFPISILESVFSSRNCFPHLIKFKPFPSPRVLFKFHFLYEAHPDPINLK